MQDTHLIPYCNVDGSLTFSEADLRGFYEQMASDGTADTVFHAGDVRSADDFLSLVVGRNPFYVVAHEGEHVGLIWLSHIEHRTCRVHFTGFSNIWGKDTHTIGRDAIHQILNMKTAPDGEFVFDTLLGLIPSWNMRGVNWLKKVGLTVACEIPKALWDAKTHKSVTGTLLYLTRKEE
jgi:hypothetical protein